MVATPAGWISRASMAPRFHVTPLRASRALALRFLAHHTAICLRRFVVVLPAPVVDTLSDSKIMVRCQCPSSSGVCKAKAVPDCQLSSFVDTLWTLRSWCSVDLLHIHLISSLGYEARIVPPRQLASIVATSCSLMYARLCHRLPPFD